MMSLFYLTLFAAVSVSFATVGVDISQRTYPSSWQCVHDYGYDFAIIRVYQSNGRPDSNGPANINDAWNIGMAHVDGYIFPCYSCGNPAGQVDETINYLASNNVRLSKFGEHRVMNNGTLGATIGMLWLDIEGTQYWSGDQQSNVNFIAGMVNQAAARGVNLGIYTSSSQWSPITGNTGSFGNVPLWYAHWDYDFSFDDWRPFGGWSTPAIKQYAGDQSFCSAGWDKNFY